METYSAVVKTTTIIKLPSHAWHGSSVTDKHIVHFLKFTRIECCFRFLEWKKYLAWKRKTQLMIASRNVPWVGEGPNKLVYYKDKMTAVNTNTTKRTTATDDVNENTVAI